MLASLLLAPFVATPCLAGEWPTREYAFFDVDPIPLKPGRMWPQPIDGLVRHDGRQVHVTLGYDYDQRQHVAAPNAISAVTAHTERALHHLEAGGWNAPNIDPLIHTPDGQVRWGLLWFTGTMDTLFRYRSRVNLSAEDWQYVQGQAQGRQAELDAKYAKRPEVIRNTMAYLLVHETVHGIQDNTAKGEGSDENRFFWEGVPEATSLMLIEKLDPALPKQLRTAWMWRDVNEPLDARNDPSNNAHAYNAGAFYRYLAEAHHDAFPSRLTVLKDLVQADAAHLKDRSATYSFLQDEVAERSGKVHPAVVFAEFLTEYASYGESRYTGTNDASGEWVPLKRFEWLEGVSPKDTSLNLTATKPSDSKELTLQPMAGQAVGLQWVGLDEATASAMQISIKAKDRATADALHIGEIRRRDADGETFCWETTQHVGGRIRKPSGFKCMLRRGLVHQEGGSWWVHFTLDKPPAGSGETWLMVTNAGATYDDTKEVTFELQVGRAEAKQAGKSVGPRTEPTPRHHGAAIEHGMVRSSDRLEVAYMGEDSMLFDGLPLAGAGEEVHFFGSDSAAMQNQPVGTGVMLRAKEYMVVLMRGPDGGELSGKHSAIIKDPESMSGWNPMGLVMTVGSEAYPGTEACGFQTEIQIEELERAPGHARYRMQADLFHPMKAAMAGEGCAALQAGWVEKADIELVVPRPHLLEPGRLERVQTPIQDSYDAMFDGPVVGGIATAESLLQDGPADPDDLADLEDDPWDDYPGSPGSPGGGGGTDWLPDLDGDAAKQLLCLLPVREGHYTDVDERALDTVVQALEASGCQCQVAAAAEHPDYADSIDPDLVEAIQGATDACEAVDVPTLDELDALETETLGALEAAGDLLDGQGGLDDVRALGEYVGLDVDGIPGFQTLEAWFAPTPAAPAATGDAGSSCGWLQWGLEQEGYALSATLAAAQAMDCLCPLARDVADGAPASPAARAALVAEPCDP